MPYGDPDAADPNLLVGVSLPGDRDSDLEMAWAVAEEYAAVGYGEEQLMRLFMNPRFGGPHEALRRLGEEEVRRVVRECVAAWGPVRFVVEDAPDLVGLRLPRQREEG